MAPHQLNAPKVELFFQKETKFMGEIIYLMQAKFQPKIKIKFKILAIFRDNFKKEEFLRKTRVIISHLKVP